MIRYAIAAAALFGFVLALQPGAASAQASGSTTATQHKPMKPMSHGGGMKQMGKPGHSMDNIADKLNACQAKPEADRKSCMDQATKP